MTGSVTTAFSVTAIIVNNTVYTLASPVSSPVLGQISILSAQILPNIQLPAFVGFTEMAGAGCQGTVTYSLLDQNGNVQGTAAFSYTDVTGTPNAYSATMPVGLSCSAIGPESGAIVAVIYTAAGSSAPAAV